VITWKKRIRADNMTEYQMEICKQALFLISWSLRNKTKMATQLTNTRQGNKSHEDSIQIFSSIRSKDLELKTRSTNAGQMNNSQEDSIEIFR